MKRPKQRTFVAVEVHEAETADLGGDYLNVAMLLFLYFLQGIPMGISSAVPILLQNRGVSYADQAGFSFAFYPFSLKILWAPIVDSVYIRAFGRRKTWLIPSQLLIGAFMIYLAQNVNEWMGDGQTQGPQMVLLTTVFFLLYFLTATQDIAVDGWALTMLERKNVGHAGTCNAVGLPAGIFFGYVVFLVLESKEFCNKYIFSEPRDVGLATLSGFLKFWGIAFIGATVLIAIFKRERSEFNQEIENNPEYSIKKAYPMLWKIINLKAVLRLSLVFLTVKISFAACDAVTTLKLIDYGIPKDKIALISIPLVPVQLLLPFVISRFTIGPYPMTFYIKAYPYRLAMTVVIGVFVFFTPLMLSGRSGDDIPTSYYVAISTIYLLYQIPLRAMYVVDTAFMARISDPLVGGTYMTLLNTISNIGYRWSHTFFLWLVDIITWKSCVHNNSSNSTTELAANKCIGNDAETECIKSGGHCEIFVDGYYLEVVGCLVYGIFWYQWGKRTLNYWQNLDLKEWHVLAKLSDVENVEGTPLDMLKE